MAVIVRNLRKMSFIQVWDLQSLAQFLIVIPIVIPKCIRGSPEVHYLLELPSTQAARHHQGYSIFRLGNPSLHLHL